MMDRKEETKVVKKALVDAGFNGVRVKHGTGTAWGWLNSYVDLEPAKGCTCDPNPDPNVFTEKCRECREHWHESYVKVMGITIQASKRDAYDAKSVNVHLNR